jgi:hypothetical protein
MFKATSLIISPVNFVELRFFRTIRLTCCVRPILTGSGAGGFTLTGTATSSGSPPARASTQSRVISRNQRSSWHQKIILIPNEINEVVAVCNVNVNFVMGS